MADDELDALYSVRPSGFTAQRTELSAAARRRGDEAAAKRISASRKPTTAAWVVNQLAIRDKDVARRIADLGDRLRSAHAAMDGHRIRELSGEQHRLIQGLVRSAFDQAGVSASAAVREDVTSTLQAAIADPEVRARLGRLDRPEQWSGFGAYGDDAEPSPAKSPEKGREKRVDRRREELAAAVATAEREKADADDKLAQSKSERQTARERRDEVLADLRRAERELDRAEKNYDKAQQASHDAAELLREAKAHLQRS
ncbi:hypothetical protein MAAFP003_2988 [Mycobacterium ahvazicum]|uniref:Uncharacterized protein n=1 Tax=Mycobacterium ahvazicum TaxID=1964395 RepID=A0A2K4YBZ0_9MYCO|nr:hypothetical protein [Mycobacterium ahvazicum]SOX54312.1 hypothetical protein MAAFP003_2988 [Mycobacterium ahvazicum]